MAAKAPTTLYAYADLSAATGIPAAKLRVWFQRGKLPAADFRVGQSPAWLPETVAPWIREHQAPACP